jgi:hypothetical protein
MLQGKLSMNHSDKPDPAELLRAAESLKHGVGPAARSPSRARKEWEKSWPSDVWTIGVDRLDLLGVDEEGNLYWDGKPIEIRRPLSLTAWQRIGAVVLAVSALVAAGAAVVSAYADLMSIPIR